MSASISIRITQKEHRFKDDALEARLLFQSALRRERQQIPRLFPMIFAENKQFTITVCTDFVQHSYELTHPMLDISSEIPVRKRRPFRFAYAAPPYTCQARPPAPPAAFRAGKYNLILLLLPG